MDWAIINNGNVNPIVCSDVMAATLISQGWTLLDITNVSPKPGGGWTYDGVNFFPPEKAPKKAMDPNEFWDKWTVDEEDDAYKTGDKIILKMIRKVDRGRFNITSGVITNGMERAVQNNILTQARHDEIMGL